MNNYIMNKRTTNKTKYKFSWPADLKLKCNIS